MKIPEYITIEEVRRVCRELKIRDWTVLTEPEILPQEASAILAIVNASGMNIDLDEFRKGLEVELEHGMRFAFANVTNNHPILTGKIVLAHFMESLDYYKRLEVAEIEGDLHKAAVAKDSAKVEALYKKLIEAKLKLCQSESEQLE